MTTTALLAARCNRIERSLAAGLTDQLSLLRAARELKCVHRHLRREVLGHARAQGWTPATALADGALVGMEQELRRALVDYLTLPGDELCLHLRTALDRSFETLDLLAARS